MQLYGNSFTQGGIRLFVTSMRAADVVRLTKVDIYRAEGRSVSGYQRTPSASRARSFARYLHAEPVPLSPTVLLLNARQGLDITPAANGDTVSISPDETLWLIDGQHRVAGFRVAIEEQGQEHLKDFQIPVVITDGITPTQEAEQFRIINEMAKKVRADLARRLLAVGLQTEQGRKEIKAQHRMWEATASRVTQLLNTGPESPLLGRIQGPNEAKSPNHAVPELSFSSSLKQILRDPEYADKEPEDLAKLLEDYWEGWRRVVPSGFDPAQRSVLLKTPGIFSTHKIATYIWRCLDAQETRPTAAAVSKVLWAIPQYASDEYWRAGNLDGAAAYGSMAGFSALASMMVAELANNGCSGS
jgi:DGQHR domain-containing protein